MTSDWTRAMTTDALERIFTVTSDTQTRDEVRAELDVRDDAARVVEGVLVEPFLMGRDR